MGGQRSLEERRLAHFFFPLPHLVEIAFFLRFFEDFEVRVSFDFFRDFEVRVNFDIFRDFEVRVSFAARLAFFLLLGTSFFFFSRVIFVRRGPASALMDTLQSPIHSSTGTIFRKNLIIYKYVTGTQVSILLPQRSHWTHRICLIIFFPEDA